MLNSIKDCISYDQIVIDFLGNSIESVNLFYNLAGDYRMQYDFLSNISQYSKISNMRMAADLLLRCNEMLMCAKLEGITSISKDLAKALGQDVFLDPMSKDLIETFMEGNEIDQTIAFGFGCYNELMDKIYNPAKLYFNLGIFAGDMLFGTSNTFIRYTEMTALKDIRNANLEAIKSNSISKADDQIEAIQKNRNAYYCVLGTDLRGEYCVYQMVVSEGQFLSVLGLKNRDKYDELYDSTCFVIESQLGHLDRLLPDRSAFDSEDTELENQAEAELTGVYNAASDAFMQFIRNGSYNGIIDSEDMWLDSAAQECAGVQWGASACEYSILDIDVDGIPELLIKSIEEEDFWYYAAVFTYDPDSKNVELMGKLHTVNDIQYSPYLKAILYFDEFMYTGGKTDFYTIESGELHLMYWLYYFGDYYRGDDQYGLWKYEDSHVTAEISKDEYERYFQDAEPVLFLPITIENGAMDGDSPEDYAVTMDTENNDGSTVSTWPELTAYYWYSNVQSWEVYEFNEDGGFQVHYTELPFTPSENTQLSSSDFVDFGEMEHGYYVFDGVKLTMYPDSSEAYTMELFNKYSDAIPDSTAEQYISDYDGAIYFYQTGWEPFWVGNALVGDPAYMVRLGRK